jgi:hypothetical protein
MLKRLLLVGLLAMSSSCLGSYALFNTVKKWNGTLGDKWVNSVVHAALWFVPAYEFAFAADLLFLNTIEFWTGKNPVTHASADLKAADQVNVASLQHRYDLQQVDNKTVAVRVDAKNAFVLHQEPTGWVIDDYQNLKVFHVSAQQALQLAQSMQLSAL